MTSPIISAAISSNHSEATPVWEVETVKMLVALGSTYKPAGNGSFPTMKWETTTPHGGLDIGGYLEPGYDWRYFVTFWDGTWKCSDPRLRTQDLTEACAKVAEILNEVSHSPANAAAGSVTGPVRAATDTGPVMFPTYTPAPGTAMHHALVEADARAAYSVQFGNPWGDLPTSWVRFLGGGIIWDAEASPHTPSEMMTELLAQPPAGMDDPTEVFLHALSTPDTIVSFFLEADIDDTRVRWQGAFDPEVLRPRRVGFHTLELKQIRGDELLDLTDLPLLR